MNRLLLSVLILTLICSSPALSNSSDKNDDNDWYPFVIPAKLDLDSPANIGKLVLDAPAGKHGFCKVNDDHFYFDDGTPARFWGTNLCFNACFPSREQAELIANRLAFFGFNAVRLTHLDFYFEPRGIFKDISPAYKDPQMKKTGVLSKTQLDRLDYLIYQLKLRGIYVDINLLVSRHFTKADGVVDADKLGMAAKPVSMFDGTLIVLQKKYARDLLTHYNPYTKLRYCDDPVIAIIEITNENSLEKEGAKKMPEYYAKELEEKWLKWQNNAKNTKQDFYIDLEKKYFKTMARFLKKGLNIRVPITGSQFSSIQIQEESCDFIDRHAYWDHPKFPNKSWDIKDFQITNLSMLKDRKTGIIGGLQDIGQVVSTKSKPFTITEWNHCYPNQYAYETPVLIATKAAQNNWDGLFQFAFSHGWGTAPVLDDIHIFFDALPNTQNLILDSVGSCLFLSGLKPEMKIENGVFELNYSNMVGMAGNIKKRNFTVGILNVTSDTEGAIFLYSADKKPLGKSRKLILAAVSQVANKASGWKNAKFDWGKAPVLLKKMNAQIMLNSGRNYKIYELSANGSRGKKVTTNYSSNTLTFSTQDSRTPWFELSLQ